MAARRVLFGAGLGAWNGPDASDVAGISRLVWQAGATAWTCSRWPTIPTSARSSRPTRRWASCSGRPRGSPAWSPSLTCPAAPPRCWPARYWLSAVYRESRPLVDEAATAAGQDPADVIDVYNFGGRITPEALPVTRDEDGRWIGGSVRQWVDELTGAVLEHGAAGFIYRSTDDTPAETAVARFAREIVPAVRAAMA